MFFGVGGKTQLYRHYQNVPSSTPHTTGTSPVLTVSEKVYPLYCPRTPFSLVKKRTARHNSRLGVVNLALLQRIHVRMYGGTSDVRTYITRYISYVEPYVRGAILTVNGSYYVVLFIILTVLHHPTYTVDVKWYDLIYRLISLQCRV